MSFNSFEFIVFFIIVYLLYLSCRQRLQNRLLLVASYVFYGFWDWRCAGLILISTVTDYFCARRIHAAEQGSPKRKAFLLLSLGINLAILFFFKYFNFFLDSFLALTAGCGISLTPPLWRVILPVGISFYTFQTLSYTIDVYRRQIEPTRNFFDYALFVSFFPQLVAGPIERARNLLPQITTRRTIDKERFAEGLFLVYWGFFKKMFIAEHLAMLIRYIDQISTADAGAAGGYVLATGYVFVLQLYIDFSAYTDIARGIAKLLGFELMENFRAPLLAANVQQLWNRWHISLTTWIRDYLYYPLVLSKIAGQRIPPQAAVLITFVLMGLWHGAAWTFVCWGLYHGIVLAVYVGIKPFLRQLTAFWEPPAWFTHLARFASVLLTFHVSVIGILFFRSDSMAQCGQAFNDLFLHFGLNVELLILLGKAALYASPVLVFDLFHQRRQKIMELFQVPWLVRYGLFYASLYFLVVHRTLRTTFLYFQF